jgi:son of sevenless-like protein
MTTTSLATAPPPIQPKFTRQLKLLDIDPLELARQLTIMESRLYQSIKPMECLQRSRETKADYKDNITNVTQNFNRVRSVKF